MTQFEFNGEKYTVANPYDGEVDHAGRKRYPHAVVITVGIYCWDRILVFTDKSCDMCDLDSVLEEALDALPTKDWDCSEQVDEAFDDAISEGKTQEEAWDESMEDVTPINGGSHYISDWNPSDASDELEAAAREHSAVLVEDD